MPSSRPAELIAAQQREFRELWRSGPLPDLPGLTARGTSRAIRYAHAGQLAVSVEVSFVNNQRLMEYGALWALELIGECHHSAFDACLTSLNDALGPVHTSEGQPALLRVASRHDPQYMPPLRRDGTLSFVADSDIAVAHAQVLTCLNQQVLPLLTRLHRAESDAIEDILGRDGQGYQTPARLVAALCAHAGTPDRFDELAASGRLKKLARREDTSVARLRDWVHSYCA
ncbi:hypothetical protein [Glutamicibacter endophyticus]|uniref:hypothetical protein n=1 Tax=Glutamicibacter endophyticus TaxID=1522174 RepID=UPI003AEFDAB8